MRLPVLRNPGLVSPPRTQSDLTLARVFRWNTSFNILLRKNVFSVFLPAADIASFVGKGDVDIGITGHDVVLESQMGALVAEALPLGVALALVFVASQSSLLVG